MSTWSVAADDRTGALEVAGLLASHLGPTTVSVGRLASGSGVVDIGTRAVDAAEAARRAAAIDERSVQHRFHKIDSTLRGNWAVELRARASRGPLVVLPAWPELGRTCSGGVVHVHGRAIGSLRDHLPELELLPTVAALRDWLSTASAGVSAACDIATTDEMVAAAQATAVGECLVAGPAGPVAAAVLARLERPLVGRPFPPPLLSRVSSAVVVCGSANPVAIAQVARVREQLPDVAVFTTPPVVGPDASPAPADLTIDAARRLADEARRHLAGTHTPLVIVVGGDTAAQLLGDEPRRVYGMAAPGMPYSLDADDGGPTVVTKAGGFGDPDALVRLLRVALGENG